MSNQKYVKKTNFIRMVGSMWLNGKGVFAYNTSQPGFVMLIAETTGGKVLNQDECNDRAIVTITEEEYENEFNFTGTKALLDAFKKVGVKTAA